jgi:hypothetical protein
VSALVVAIGVRVGTLRVGITVANAAGVVALSVTPGVGNVGVGDSGTAAAQATSHTPMTRTLQRATNREKFSTSIRGILNPFLLYHKPQGFAFFYLLRRI